MSEQEILDRYSTPGLRKHELDRDNKRDQLNSLGMSRLPEERDAILDQLYGPDHASSS